MYRRSLRATACAMTLTIVLVGVELFSSRVLGASSQQKTLVISHVIVNETPQSGTWLMCFSAEASEAQNTFNEPNRTFSGDGIKIPMNLKLAPASIGEQVEFKMFLDDDQSSVCSDSAEDKSYGSFKAGTGAKQVNADSFNYVVHYRIE